MFGWLALAVFETTCMVVLTLIYTSVYAFSWLFVFKVIVSIWIINLTITAGLVLMYRKVMQ